MRGEWRCAAEKLHSTPNSTVAPRPVHGWKNRWNSRSKMAVLRGLKHEKWWFESYRTVEQKHKNRDYCDFFCKNNMVDESYQPLTMAY